MHGWGKLGTATTVASGRTLSAERSLEENSGQMVFKVAGGGPDQKGDRGGKDWTAVEKDVKKLVSSLKAVYSVHVQAGACFSLLGQWEFFLPAALNTLNTVRPGEIGRGEGWSKLLKAVWNSERETFQLLASL